MPDLTQLVLFFAAAFVLAITPGPGIFYVAARTLAGGRSEGMASTLGTGFGGMVHVVGGSLGVSRGHPRYSRSAAGHDPTRFRRDHQHLIGVCAERHVAPNPLPNRATDAGTKAFMLAFTQALARELSGTGVKVQVCLPGRVETEFHTSQGIDITALPPMMKR
jgi:NAD(P)-dependent dehydrogenase (short-subunit alcohol dehydrogenase family)